jgi:hypothetical protein
VKLFQLSRSHISEDTIQSRGFENLELQTTLFTSSWLCFSFLYLPTFLSFFFQKYQHSEGSCAMASISPLSLPPTQLLMKWGGGGSIFTVAVRKTFHPSTVTSVLCPHSAAADNLNEIRSSASGANNNVRHLDVNQLNLTVTAEFCSSELLPFSQPERRNRDLIKYKT